MGRKIILYHGSDKIIEKPEFGKGKAHNDFGLGFYCTESEDLAKEWACSSLKDGLLISTFLMLSISKSCI